MYLSVCLPVWLSIYLSSCLLVPPSPDLLGILGIVYSEKLQPSKDTRMTLKVILLKKFISIKDVFISETNIQKDVIKHFYFIQTFLTCKDVFRGRNDWDLILDPEMTTGGCNLGNIIYVTRQHSVAFSSSCIFALLYINISFRMPFESHFVYSSCVAIH